MISAFWPEALGKERSPGMENFSVVPWLKVGAAF